MVARNAMSVTAPTNPGLLAGPLPPTTTQASGDRDAGVLDPPAISAGRAPPSPRRPAAIVGRAGGRRAGRMSTGAPASPAVRAPAVETPLFLTSGERPLYAVYHAPARARPGAPVVVHCHGLGVEQVTGYRVEVLSARSAAAAGFPVLRFHARGHGDSGGDFAAVTLERLVEDALAAAAEAARRSGADRVVWLGVRFGALVAAGALERGPRAAGLVLWEPVHRPMDYFRSQLRGLLYSQVAGGKRPSATVDELLALLARAGHVDVHGYYLHQALVESARAETLESRLAAWRGPTLIAQVEARPGLSSANTALAESLAARGAPVATFRLPEEPGWQFLSNPAWEGAPLVARTAEWLDALA